jgi:hypothetical protein
MTIEQSDKLTRVYSHVIVGVLLSIITLSYFLRFYQTRPSQASSSDKQKIPNEISESQSLKYPLSLNNEALAHKSSDDSIKPPDFSTKDNGWRCACEGGFLPPSLLKSFGGMEAAVKLGMGQCYHKSS